VRRLAVLTDIEILEFERKISKNYLIKAMGVQECPKCNSMVERSDKKHIRVICPLCSKDKEKVYEFCWHCLHEWKESSYPNKCGEFLSCVAIKENYKNSCFSYRCELTANLFLMNSGASTSGELVANNKTFNFI